MSPASRARESNLWDWIQVPVAAAYMAMWRIESLVGSGIPDVCGCINGSTFWLELKSVARHPIALVWCELKSDQAMRLRTWRRCGGRAFVLVQVGIGAAAKRYLVDGFDSDKLLEPIPEANLARLALNCGDEDAADILEIIERKELRALRGSDIG